MKNAIRKLTPAGQILVMVAVCKAQTLRVPDQGKALDNMKVLRAISEVESGTVDHSKPFRKVGKKGERSAWQITEAVWKQYTKEPFHKASTDAVLARQIAWLHIEHLRLKLNVERMLDGVFAVAVAWNAGIACAVGDKPLPKTTCDYALRVMRIYDQL